MYNEEAQREASARVSATRAAGFMHLTASSFSEFLWPYMNASILALKPLR